MSGVNTMLLHWMIWSPGFRPPPLARLFSLVYCTNIPGFHSGPFMILKYYSKSCRYTGKPLGKLLIGTLDQRKKHKKTGTVWTVERKKSAKKGDRSTFKTVTYMRFILCGPIGPMMCEQ